MDSHTTSEHRKERETAFDIMSRNYYTEVVLNPSMLLMRQRVWNHLRNLVEPGSEVLDLGCGIGIDSLFLAKQKCKVYAIDSSSLMVENAKQRLKRANLNHFVDLEKLDIEELHTSKQIMEKRFHCVLANFGSLNTLRNFSSLDTVLAKIVIEDGIFIANVMGRYSIWDWILSTLKFLSNRKYSQRQRTGHTIILGEGRITSYYPTPAEFAIQFSHFKQIHCEALGFLYPPPWITAKLRSLSLLWKALDTIEQLVAKVRIFQGRGDHFLIIMKKKGKSEL